ncbi:MAG TPA: YicC/YloC family endoribonuclease [Thermoanaerobaculia bacterium]|nr:YicC/YloC family endoribonuclease [Thermoanaerobaculia bacterium]
MRSMTGYGEAAAENSRHSVAVALRAVNHRFLDLQVRLAEECRGCEAALRDQVGREVARGRVEMRVEVKPLVERRATVQLHMGVVQAAHAATHKLVEEGLIERGLAAGDLLRIPEAFRVELAGEAWDGDDQELLLKVAGEAVAQLVRSREREGASLAATLTERLCGLDAAAARLDVLRAGVKDEITAALKRRLAELLEGQSVDESRLAQEVALLVDRSDVSEELDRLRSHLEHFRSLLEEPGPSGKRLDFLTQEVFRELNTLGAKCRNAEMTRAVLDAKVICEQLREQVQNVE